MDDEGSNPAARMVSTQIRSRGIRDPRVLDVMSRVARERFVDLRDRPYAYRDGPLPIGEGQTISQPYIVAYMTELLQLSGVERVLEIGTGSGYQTAVLAELCAQVFTVERIPVLARKARRRLTSEMGYDNIHFRVGDGKSGWPEEAPFDRILLTASPVKIPAALVAQLGDPGILVAPYGQGRQRILRLRRREGRDEKEDLIDVAFVPCV